MIGILHNIRSVHNVGSIFRSADGAGFEKLYLCGITPTPVDELGRSRQDFTKVSLDAERSLAWEKVIRIGPLLKRLKKEGFQIFCLEQNMCSIPYDKIRLSKKRRQKAVLIVGHERTGIASPILREASAIIEIPMAGAKESLNVSVAFGIAAYELNRPY